MGLFLNLFFLIVRFSKCSCFGCFVFCPSCSDFFMQSLRFMRSQPLSERRSLDVDPTHHYVPMLLSEEFQRDALWAQYAQAFPIILQSSLIAFLWVTKRLFTAECVMRLQQQTGCLPQLLVFCVVFNSAFHCDPLSSTLSISWQPKKPETNHPVFKTLLSTVISEDLHMSWWKLKKFQLLTDFSSVLTFQPFPPPIALCLLFRKVLWNHTPALLWRRRVLGPNTPPERGTVHVCGRGNQVRKSPLHK